MDAISRIIYWQRDENRGENGNAIDFINVMNKGLKGGHPGCILADEDTMLHTDWEGFNGLTKEKIEKYKKNQVIMIPAFSAILLKKL